MNKLQKVAFVILLALTPAVHASDEPMEDGHLGIEVSAGRNLSSFSEYSRVPIFFTGGSAMREISTRFLILSDVAHASEYFSGDNSFVKNKGLYLYNFGLLDIDYLSWQGKIWSAGLGGGLAHQGFLISGAEKSAHAITGRLRAQFFVYLFDYFAVQTIVTLPIAFYQSATDEFRLYHSELNLLFDFKGRVRRPEPQSFMFSASLHYDYIHLAHALRSYSYHDFTPMFKATVLY